MLNNKEIPLMNISCVLGTKSTYGTFMKGKFSSTPVGYQLLCALKLDVLFLLS